MKKAITVTGMLMGIIILIVPVRAEENVSVDFDQVRIADSGGEPVTEEEVQITYSEARLAITLCMIAEEYRNVNRYEKACAYYELSLSLRPEYARTVKGYTELIREMKDNGVAVRVSMGET